MISSYARFAQSLIVCTISLISKGFGIKAQALHSCNTCFSFACAEKNTTGIAKSFLRSLQTSVPILPGSITSSNITSGPQAATLAGTPSPVLWVYTSNPAFLRIYFTRYKISGSSSTTRIFFKTANLRLANVSHFNVTISEPVLSAFFGN